MMNMNRDISPRSEVVRVSREAAPPTHFPVTLGGENYIMTQQEVRTIRDVRKISFQKVLPNGTMIAAHLPEQFAGDKWDAMASVFRSISQAHEKQSMFGKDFQNVNQFRDCRNDAYAAQAAAREAQAIAQAAAKDARAAAQAAAQSAAQLAAQAAAQSAAQAPAQAAAQCGTQVIDQPLGAGNYNASLETQLIWGRCNNNSSSPFPQHITTKTSTTELNSAVKKDCLKDPQKSPSAHQCPSRHVSFSRIAAGAEDRDQEKPVRLTALEQLKIRKMKQNSML